MTEFRNKILHGNSLDVLKRMPDECVHMAVTSPPYFGLRSYDVPPTMWNGDENCNHEWSAEIPAKYVSHWETFEWKDGRPANASRGWKDKVKNSKQTTCGSFCFKCGAWKGCLGQEPSMEMYIKHLNQIFTEMKRVLRKDGTFWLNLGDSYAGSGSPGGDFRDGKKGDIYLRPYKRRGNGLKTKDQGLIPHRIALTLQGFAVIYGDELWKLVDTLHRAQEENDWEAVVWVEEVLCRWALATKLADSSGWWVRSTIIWQKSNSLPSNVNDRPANNFEYVFLLSKSKRYYYDAEAIKVPQKEISIKRAFATNHLERRKDFGKKVYAFSSESQKKSLAKLADSVRNGKQAKRHKRCVWTIPTHAFKEAHFATFPSDLVRPMILAGSSPKVCAECGAPWKRTKDNSQDKSESADWRPTCDCNAETSKAIILDPFMGAGTTALVATELGRDFVGIEIGEKYIGMTKRRLEGIMLPLSLGGI